MLIKDVLKNKDIANSNVSVDNGKLVATVKGHESHVDNVHSKALAAHKADADWDSMKPELRGVAVGIIDEFAAFNTVVHTVNLLGSENKFIEIASSARRKEVPSTMDAAVKALQEGLGTELVVEEMELTIKGELAKWVLKNLEGQEGNPDLQIKRKQVLVPKFEDVRRNVHRNLSEGPTTSHLAGICDALAYAGIFAPSVEAKFLKGK